MRRTRVRVRKPDLLAFWATYKLLHLVCWLAARILFCFLEKKVRKINLRYYSPRHLLRPFVLRSAIFLFVCFFSSHMQVRTGSRMLLAVVTFFFKGKKELVNIEYPTSVLNHKSFKLFNIYIYIYNFYVHKFYNCEHKVWYVFLCSGCDEWLLMAMGNALDKSVILTKVWVCVLQICLSTYGVQVWS